MLQQTQWTLYWFFATYAGELQGYCMTASSFTACMVAALSHTWWPLVILATKDALQMIKTKPPSDCVRMCLAEWMWHNFCGACSRAGWREPSCDCLQIMCVSVCHMWWFCSEYSLFDALHMIWRFSSDSEDTVSVCLPYVMIDLQILAIRCTTHDMRFFFWHEVWGLLV